MLPVNEDIAKVKGRDDAMQNGGMRWEEYSENRLELVQRLYNFFRILGEILVKVAI